MDALATHRMAWQPPLLQTRTPGALDTGEYSLHVAAVHQLLLLGGHAKHLGFFVTLFTVPPGL
jgi:hypothetical protein